MFQPIGNGSTFALSGVVDASIAAGVDVTSISGSADAADNLEKFALGTERIKSEPDGKR